MPAGSDFTSVLVICTHAESPLPQAVAVIVQALLAVESPENWRMGALAAEAVVKSTYPLY